MIQEYLFPQLENLNMPDLWFQQDGATPYIQQERPWQY